MFDFIALTLKIRVETLWPVYLTLSAYEPVMVANPALPGNRTRMAAYRSRIPRCCQVLHRLVRVIVENLAHVTIDQTIVNVFHIGSVIRPQILFN
jgi:hypothetical protein